MPPLTNKSRRGTIRRFLSDTLGLAALLLILLAIYVIV